MSYRYSDTLDRYRNTETGRFVSRKTVLAGMNQSLEASGDKVRTLAGMVANGEISPADWHERMRADIKSEYIRQYLAGRGGLGSMTSEDWGSTGGMIGKQYGFLKDFADEVKSGNLSEAEIARRAEMYINSSREAYERAHGRAAMAGGFTEEKWELADAEHCTTCVEYANKGWVPIGSIGATPADGSTECRQNCKCSMSYR